MSYFSKMTTTTNDPNRRNVVIMGRRSWDCIPSKFKPLPNRINFVLSRSNLNLSEYPDTFVFNSLQKAIDVLHSEAFKDLFEQVWIIGGASLYEEALNSSNFYKLYLTKIHKVFDCDTFIPDLTKNLKEIDEPNVPKEVQEENGVNFSYHVYIK
ncbi:hypothetical protein ABEB36_014284 [Hypothenemus hampei]|uniref:dihydrofolate reductase n=1 Tax=Hypothenemus hampei TaxID=57062 RepID=A0ABD1E475_HYPHA